MKINKLRNCIIINSLTYFLLAYFIVVFSSNLFIILIAKLVGFNAILTYNGFVLTDVNWTNENIITIYFFGNLGSLVLAIFFLRKYYMINNLRKNIKILYLWIYIISISWFFGEIIVGILFKTGMEAAFIAFGIPYFLRLLLAVIGIFALINSGKNTQKDVMYSANLYYTLLSEEKTKMYFFKQIILPALFGLIIVILLKLPNLSKYNYVDLYKILTIIIFIAGLFLKNRRKKSMYFKVSNKKECSVSYLLIIILITLIIFLRVGLNSGVQI